LILEDAVLLVVLEESPYDIVVKGLTVLTELPKVPGSGIEDIDVSEGHPKVDDHLIEVLFPFYVFHHGVHGLLVDFFTFFCISESIVDFLDVKVGCEGVDSSEIE
jgi:hypothetical protein